MSTLQNTSNGFPVILGEDEMIGLLGGQSFSLQGIDDPILPGQNPDKCNKCDKCDKCFICF